MSAIRQVSNVRRAVEKPSRRPVILEYIDGEGERSTREIVPISISGPTVDLERFEPVYLEAMCKKAKAHRTFRFDRIQTVGDIRTGEIFEIDDWIDGLQLGEPDVELDPEDISGLLAHPDDNPPQHQSAKLRWSARWPIYRATLIAGTAGYLIGRARVIGAIVHFFGWRHGLGL